MAGIDGSQTFEAVSSGIQTATQFMPEPVSKGVDFFGSLARAALGSGSSDFGGSAQELINKQIELQQQMLQITMITNIERTKHETQMAPARNIRLG